MDNLISNFSIDALLSFFKTKISSFKPVKENLSYILTDNHFNQFIDLIKIGETTFNGTEDLLVFTCKAKTLLSERSSKKQQFEIAKKVLKDDFKDGAIFVFYDDAGSFRFSFLRKNYGNKEQKFTTWKRYTYYVEKDKTNKTFKNRVSNADFSSLDAIQKAFSVEKLTEDFYKELFAWYQWTLSEEIGVTFPNNTETHEDDRVKLEEQIIRLITRLLFVWFIKQKKLVPNNLFDTESLKSYLKDFDPNSKEEGNYYNAILQNLFFATLNKDINERSFSKLVKERDIKTLYRYAEMFTISETEVLALFNQVPFLNGGLFECLDKTEKMNGTNQVLDGFSKNPTKSANGNFKHRAFIPNCVFFDEKKGIITLLERYNFTVEENAPNEIQVALDPELLGNVFENLLGAFNPETKETARKQSGSFYTPREIVSYMVDESLIFYLLNAFPSLVEDQVRALFTAEDLPTDFANNQSICEEVSLKLKDIKILDPACGSGAFPMGILNRMVEVLEKLDNYKNKSLYDLKLHLIEECIYGVDIQTIAVQISKLRFFISLIVEEGDINFSKKEDNYGILTLPNLETKFVAANTLIGIKRKPAQHNLFENPLINQTKENLLAIRKEHFYAKTANRKKTLREKDAELRERLSLLLQNNNDYTAEDAIQFSQWNPYNQNASSPFFDIEWMFGLKSKTKDEGCFDIIIGNPPYISAPNMVKTNPSGRIAIQKSNSFSTLYQKWDIYIPFIELSLQQLTDIGISAIIIPYPFTNQTYGKKLRELIIQKFALKEVVDLNGTKIFESATVSNCIPFISRGKTDIGYCIISKITEGLKIEPAYKKNYVDLVQDEKTAVWNLGEGKRDIDRFSHMYILGDFCYISKGMVLNSDEKISEGSFVKEDLISDFQDKIHNRKYIEAKDIEKYRVKRVRYLEYNSDRCPAKLSRPTFKELYDQPKLMFNRLGNLMVYHDKEIKFLHSDSMFSAVLWKDLRKIKNKSISASVKRYSRYSRDEMELKSNMVDLRYLIGILNSKYASNLLSNIRGGDYHIYPEHLRNIPIPIISTVSQEKIILIVDEIHLLKSENEDTLELEKKIDILVYNLYGLTHEEVLIIDREFSFSQSEYDNLKIEA